MRWLGWLALLVLGAVALVFVAGLWAWMRFDASADRAPAWDGGAVTPIARPVPDVAPDGDNKYPTDTDNVSVFQKEIIRLDALNGALLKLSEVYEILVNFASQEQSCRNV